MTAPAVVPERCLCGSTNGLPGTLYGLSVVRCACGILRQPFPGTEADLRRWYAEEYYDAHGCPGGNTTHTPEHDRGIAEQRLDAYALPAGCTLLDLGSGNNAFVDAAIARGLDAWGQDLATQSEGPRTYVGPLEELAFPTAMFDVLTAHDVLEHVSDLHALLREVRRILRPGGDLIVDFPRFWHESGAHHWRTRQHLWLLQEDELALLLQQHGFTITERSYPIESKVLFRATAQPIERVRIAMPAGIGDTYWCLVKLPGFLRAHGITTPPEVIVADTGGPKRAVPFLRNFPMIYSGGYVELSPRVKLWRKAYLHDAQAVWEHPFKWMSPPVEWFMAYNGKLTAGHSLAATDPEWVPEWRPRMFWSKEATDYEAQARAALGRYAVAFIADHGMYRLWLNAFGESDLRATLRLVERDLGLSIVVMGAEWDRGMTGEYLAQTERDWTDLVGVTSLDQMLGLLRGASLVFGHPAGNTMLGPMLRTPTVLLWHDFFPNRGFWRNCVAPGSPYEALNVTGLSVEEAVAACVRVVRAGEGR